MGGSFGDGKASSSVLQHPTEMVPKEVANFKTIQVEAEISEGKSEMVESITVSPPHWPSSLCLHPHLLPWPYCQRWGNFHSFGRFGEARSICLGDSRLSRRV